MSQHKQLSSCDQEVATLCRPDQVVWCDGSADEYQAMLRAMVQGGTAIRLDERKRANSVFVRSDPADVARVEEFTFICSKSKDDAGPTNHWRDPEETKHIVRRLFDVATPARTL